MTDQTAKDRALALMEKLWNDGDVGEKVQRAAKDLFPDVKTNEDIFAPALQPLRKQNDDLQKQLEEIRAERAAEKKEREQSSMKMDMETKLESARKAYNLTEDGFNKVVERMKETGNYSDPEAAAAWVASKTTPTKDPSVQAYGQKHMDLFGTKNRDEKFARLHNDPLQYMDDELNEFARDPDRYVQETMGY